MSISQAQRARLGIFVIIGTVLLVTFFAIPFGVRFTSKFNTFIAFFQGESLSGLEQGAVVKFSGVPIGKIIKINYLPDDLSRVKVIMEIQEDFPMKTDMVATTGAMGITGLKYVEITGGTNDAAPLKPGSEIKTKVSPFTAITGKAESIIAKVELLLNHLNEISNPDSLKSIKKIIDNVADITGTVRAFVDETRPGVNAIASSTDSILNQVSVILLDVKSFTETMNSNIATLELAQTLAKVDSTVQSLKFLSDNVSMIVRQSREDFSIGMQNIREATENANQLTKILAENPSLLLKGETQRERNIR
ncbi:MAG: MCE family protein [Chitinispirillaceae bacterium]|nr:MCE family protein [Chitinispirillaceae bacterium]